MEKLSLHQHLSTAHPAETLAPSLLTRLSVQEKNNLTKPSLQERLSSKLKPWLNHLGQEKPKNHKLSLRLVKSLPMNQQETSNSNLMHSNDMYRCWMESKPSLLNRIDMGRMSPVQCSESEEMDLLGEINDLKNLTGVIPPSLNQLRTDVDNFLQRLSEGNDFEEDESALGGDSGDNDGHESDNESGGRGQSNKKQRIYESQMPWFKTEQRFRKSNTNRSCNKTRSILDIIQRDPATVKRWIRCASSAPAGFASTEWDALIKGESINIDTVFSSLHHVHSVDENIGRVGTTEIQFGRPKPAAKVETSGQWTTAFNLVVKATAFLFPHRYDELKQYEDYIEELFSAKSLAVHPKLFKYDEA